MRLLTQQRLISNMSLMIQMRVRISFLAGQLPSGNEHTGDFNLGIAPTHTEIDAESSKPLTETTNHVLISHRLDTANPTRFVYSRHTVGSRTDLKKHNSKAADTLVSDKTFTLQEQVLMILMQLSLTTTRLPQVASRNILLMSV